MPPNIAALPLDSRGYPIPFTVAFINGKWDFAVVDPTKWEKALKQKLCGICGKPNHGRNWFIGGKMCFKNRLFYDHPMHEECARYAMQVCPYLAIPKMIHRKKHGAGTKQVAGASDIKPDVFMLGKAKGYNTVRYGQDVYLMATPWEHVEWWRGGSKITLDEFEETEEN